MTETATVYWLGILTSLLALERHPITDSREQAGHSSRLHYGGGVELPFIGGIDFRWAHQLPGKPATGTGGKHVGSY